MVAPLLPYSTVAQGQLTCDCLGESAITPSNQNRIGKLIQFFNVTSSMSLGIRFHNVNRDAGDMQNRRAIILKLEKSS